MTSGLGSSSKRRRAWSLSKVGRQAPSKSSRRQAEVKGMLVQEYTRSISIRGARTHNLRNVDLDLPHGKLTVITGVSGSGKSSLAFDTIFAESQRRYIECLAPFSRHVLRRLERPDVDDIRGLPPSISVSQTASSSNNPRSTVATLTDIHHYLRLLYARVGDVFCHRCGTPMQALSIDEMLDRIEALPDGERLHVLAPLVRGRKGSHREEFLKIRREGFVRARLNGSISMVDGPIELDPTKPHDLEMVVDRQIVRPEMRERMTESLQTALKHGGGTVIIAVDREGEWVDHLFNSRYSCGACEVSYAEIEPRTFSFNSPHGACPTCQGLGTRLDFVEEAVIPDPTRSLTGGAVVPFRTKGGKATAALLKSLKTWANGPSWLERPVAEMPEEVRHELWNGSDKYPGLRKLLQQADLKQDEDDDDPFAAFRRTLPCPDCDGTRLGPIGRSVTIGGVAITTLLGQSVEEIRGVLASMDLKPEKRAIAGPILRDLDSRLGFLKRVGVGYIALDRPVATLSGGESQRIRLASCLGAGLNGACYIVDEPTAGLHARDTSRLLGVMEDLRHGESTVLVVEHDANTIRRADVVVEIGPGAGSEGGTILRSAPLEAFLDEEGLTADYLSGRRQVVSEPRTPSEDPTSWLTIRGVRHHNLDDVTAAIPLQRLVAITGVSGSGKSSLVVDCLAPAIRRALDLGGPPPGAFDVLEGVDQIGRLVVVDQRPIGRTPRSTPATHVGVFDEIRALFARSRQAKLRGFPATRFSYNHKSGQCPECKGMGALRVSIPSLGDEFHPCPACRGQRYNRATLQVRYRGCSIADVLELSIEAAAEFFVDHPRVAPILKTLVDVGLGYLKLGQWGTTLSGGESQRLKLARDLGREREATTLYMLDEPTTGLHFHDVARLYAVLRGLVDRGHSVVLIEHDLDLIRASDWILDLGPEGGSHGGRIVAQGPPDIVAQSTESITGAALRGEFA
ncbi:UvrABC system protein A [Planctomycetes bacterium Pan216]|uniref:UvrABC system protein A n=1 Tax=Kolteria novifilia TaxID=2527975 RepID=A0A518B6A7_9BACT|nr:UvrABC system protein A [Planctomycetes bacterium Pan216]